MGDRVSKLLFTIIEIGHQFTLEFYHVVIENKKRTMILHKFECEGKLLCQTR